MSLFWTLEARRYTLGALSRYWPADPILVDSLPCPLGSFPNTPTTPPDLRLVTLPDWASDVTAEGGLLVPSGAVVPGEGEDWRRTDWLASAFWYLSATAERDWEREHRPIGSYSFRLKGWDSRLWRRAWVNRIALFLRRWAAHQAGRDEASMFGPLPSAEIILTHDVDALAKALPLRLKRLAFNGFNGLRRLARGDLAQTFRHQGFAGASLVDHSNHGFIDRVADLEEYRGLSSRFHFYAGIPGTSLQAWFLDPSYDIEKEAGEMARRLRSRGFPVGLHQSYGAWRDAKSMRTEKERLEHALGSEVNSCRQHWLRFCWRDTWSAQEAAGLRLDMTLGFNDRPGFRSGAALRYRPWDPSRGGPLNLETVPLVLMDSHLYDYDQFEDTAREQEIAFWVDEIRQTHGTANVLWHPYTLSPDIGWAGGFKLLLEAIE